LFSVISDVRAVHSIQLRELADLLGSTTHATQLANVKVKRMRKANMCRVLKSTRRGRREVVADAKQGRWIATTAVRYCSGERDEKTSCS
jgi:hypothetical protein